MTEPLGEATAPSGVLLLVDPGLLDFWRHDRPPLLPPGTLPSAKLEEANTASDIEIVGDERRRLARVVDRQVHSRFIYDVPRSRIEYVVESVALAARRYRVPATARRLLDRIPHRKRADLAVEDGGGAGMVPMGPVTLAAIGDLPRKTPLAVTGERAERGRSLWSWIDLRVREGKAAKRETIGRLSIRRARGLFIDADAAGAWVHDESLDGLADIVFWGADAPAVAARTRARNLGDGYFGWTDLVLEQAELRRDAVADHKAAGAKFMFDYRPHSHHHALLAGMRQSGSEAAAVEVGNARAVGFFTGRGEGEMPVMREMDEAGRTLRIRLNLAASDSVRSRKSRLR